MAKVIAQDERVVVTHLEEVDAALRAQCGEDCPSHELYHIELTLDAFSELASQPVAFAARYGLPLEPGDVHVSLRHPRTALAVQTFSAVETPDSFVAEASLSISGGEGGGVPQPSTKVCCSLVGGTNSFSCFVWPSQKTGTPIV